MNKLAQLDLAKVAKSGTEGPAELARTYLNWLKDQNNYAPVGNVSVEDKMEKSAYKVFGTPHGIVFERIKPKTAELIRFKSGPMEEVMVEIDKFWDLAPDYKKLGILHNRGILLYGPAGTGKSSLVAQIIEMIIKRGDIVIYADDMRDLKSGLLAFRSIEPERKVVVVLEDADEHVKYSEQAFLHLLDGQDSIEGVLYLATTNYLERFPQRALRSGRFDKKVYIPCPPREARVLYLEKKLKKHNMETDKEIERLADETDGMNFGDMLELVTAVYALKEPVGKVLSRLKKEPEKDSGETIQLSAEGSGFMPLKTQNTIYRSGTDVAAGLDLELLQNTIEKKAQMDDFATPQIEETPQAQDLEDQEDAQQYPFQVGEKVEITGAADGDELGKKLIGRVGEIQSIEPNKCVVKTETFYGYVTHRINNNFLRLKNIPR